MPCPLVLGLKYCGSCNVIFDRSTLVDGIRSHFSEAELDIVYTNSGGPFDLVVVLNACQVACADYSDLKPKFDFFVAKSQADLDPVEGPVIPWIEGYLERGAGHPAGQL